MTNKLANQLWARASQCNEEGLSGGTIEDRHRVVAQLRQVANQLEAEPEAIKGLIFVAAAFLQVKDSCEKALTAAAGSLLMEALAEALQGVDLGELLKEAKPGGAFVGPFKFKH